MWHVHSRPRLRPAATPGLATALILLVLSGCSENVPTSPGPGGPTTYKGTLSGNYHLARIPRPAIGGSVILTVATKLPAPALWNAPVLDTVGAIAALTFAGGGPSIPLRGVYHDVTHLIELSGGGWTLNGRLTDFGVGMEGTFAGPDTVSGVFSLREVGPGADTVIAVVGSFNSTLGGSRGVLNFAIRGTVLHGHAFEDRDAGPVPLDGTYSPATGAISIIHPANPGAAPPLAVGTLQANGTASGTYNDQLGNAGAWTGVRR